MLKRPSYLAPLGERRATNQARGDLAGRRASGCDPGAAPVPSPLARHSQGEALR